MAIETDRVSLSRESSPRAVATDESATQKADNAFAQFWKRSAGGSVSARDRMFFTERMALLLDTGIPLHTALESLSAQASSPAMKDLLGRLNADVQSGSTFARALAVHEDVFPPTYINLIAAAELGGFLSVALDRLRDMEERREELRTTLVSAISYPALLAFFSTAVVIFVLVVVFPKFADIFSAIHDQLPITTRWLMAASEVLRRWWIPIAIGSAVGLKLFTDWAKGPSGSERIDRMILATPGLRDILIQLNVVQMLRVIGLSIENGVGMVDALRSAREAVSSTYFRVFLERVESGVNEGRGLKHGFNQEETIPDLVKQMIETGEESGNLPAVASRLADFYEREWRRALGMIAKLAEPAMLVVMGGVVGLIVSSLILPIFKLSRAVH